MFFLSPPLSQKEKQQNRLQNKLGERPQPDSIPWSPFCAGHWHRDMGHHLDCEVHRCASEETDFPLPSRYQRQRASGLEVACVSAALFSRDFIWLEPLWVLGVLPQSVSSHVQSPVPGDAASLPSLTTSGSYILPIASSRETPEPCGRGSLVIKCWETQTKPNFSLFGPPEVKPRV